MTPSIKVLLVVSCLLGTLGALAQQPRAGAAPNSLEDQSSSVKATGVAPSTGMTSRAPGEPDLLDGPPAPGGGPGKVWINDAWTNGSRKAYHCMDDRYYGRTKAGRYMTEANAKAEGLHPAHGKGCGG
ncbi:MAG: hypothetical protein JSS01_17235 [Proteobacteria bacterium]|nr:hypothetical protein [Pseudomonadota bacterium]